MGIKKKKRLTRDEVLLLERHLVATEMHLSAPELAARFQVNTNTLTKWRISGTGPQFLKFGTRRVLYRIEDVREWEKKQLRRHTHDSERETP